MLTYWFVLASFAAARITIDNPKSSGYAQCGDVAIDEDWAERRCFYTHKIAEPGDIGDCTTKASDTYKPAHLLYCADESPSDTRYRVVGQLSNNRTSFFICTESFSVNEINKVDGKREWLACGKHTGATRSQSRVAVTPSASSQSTYHGRPSDDGGHFVATEPTNHRRPSKGSSTVSKSAAVRSTPVLTPTPTPSAARHR
ncbi:hypothetical protein PYCC9005_003271 [Savitreella phatthalungensis]